MNLERRNQNKFSHDRQWSNAAHRRRRGRSWYRSRIWKGL